MNNRELIKELLNYNLEAEIQVVANNMSQPFSITFGSSEGSTKENCEDICFYTRNNSKEKQQ